MRHWTRASESEQRQKKETTKKKRAPGSNPPSRVMHSRMVQPIENRAVQHYSGQLSNSHNRAETDPYARHDYDAAQCPAIFTGLPPSELDAASMSGARQCTFAGATCAISASSGKGLGVCVHLLSTERREGTN